MKIKILSSLEKVFSGKAPEASELKEFSMFKNERSSFQAVFYADENFEAELILSGELSSFCKAFLVKEVPVGTAALEGSDDFYISKESGMYPDYLEPLTVPFKAEKGRWYSVWIEVSPNGYVGKSSIDVTVPGRGEASVTVEVIDAALPEQEIIYTNWYHADCLCDYYGVEAVSADFWRINEKFVKMAAEHGMNMILTPLFTPPLDTKVGGERTTFQLVKVKRKGSKYLFDFRQLGKWFDMCIECGIRYFEMSHLFTQWGAKHAPKIIVSDRKGREKKAFGWHTKTTSREYDDFLRQFAKALIPFLEKKNLREKCFFHISDEPSMTHLETYKKRAALIAEIFPGFKVIDALSNYEFYETGAVKQPIPCESDIEDFAGRVPELWTYYCCGQGDEYMPNRFMSMPSLRNRVLGILLYKYNCEGFLQWGYNFYNLQYSVKAINPFEITDAGGSFPSGDSFVVYPGCKGEPLPSLRLKVFYDAFQDLAALRLLEAKIGREKTIELIEKDLVKPLSFTEYPHDEQWLLALREKINQTVKEK